MDIPNQSRTESTISLRNRAEILLRRYPQLSQSEIEELCQFYRNAPAIDTALIASDPSIADASRRFQSEHRKETSRGVEAPLVIAIFVAGVALIGLALAINL